MRNIWCKLGALGLASQLLMSCASIVEGTNQTISVNLTPESANCTASRQGSPVGTISAASRNLTVSKSRYDIVLRCSAPDYETADVKVESGASGWGVAGAFTLDFGLTDWATGALNKYPDSVTIALNQKPKQGAEVPAK
jgi:hypothetical protein